MMAVELEANGDMRDLIHLALLTGTRRSNLRFLRTGKREIPSPCAKVRRPFFLKRRFSVRHYIGREPSFITTAAPSFWTPAAVSSRSPERVAESPAPEAVARNATRAARTPRSQREQAALQICRPRVRSKCSRSARRASYSRYARNPERESVACSSRRGREPVRSSSSRSGRRAHGQCSVAASGSAWAMSSSSCASLRSSSSRCARWASPLMTVTSRRSGA